MLQFYRDQRIRIHGFGQRLATFGVHDSAKERGTRHLFTIESDFNFMCQSLIWGVGHQTLATAQDLHCIGYITIVDRDLQLSFSCKNNGHMCAKGDYGIMQKTIKANACIASFYAIERYIQTKDTKLYQLSNLSTNCIQRPMGSGKALNRDQRSNYLLLMRLL